MNRRAMRKRRVQNRAWSLVAALLPATAGWAMDGSDNAAYEGRPQPPRRRQLLRLTPGMRPEISRGKRFLRPGLSIPRQWESRTGREPIEAKDSVAAKI